MVQSLAEAVCHEYVVHIIACILYTIIYGNCLSLANKNYVVAGLCSLLSELKVQFLLLCTQLYHTGSYQYTAGIKESEDVQGCTAAAGV